jgi:pilus assembly protein Flp/PilA
MMNRMKSIIRSEEGQGMTEYIIIVALIAIAAIAVITVFGQNIRALFAASANALTGNEDQDMMKTGGTNNLAAKRKSLSSFGKNKGGEE